MAYDKGKAPSGKKGMLTSGKGMCSYDKNPMQQPARTPVGVGPGYNADQQKVNKLLQQSQKKDESLRGVGVN